MKKETFIYRDFHSPPSGEPEGALTFKEAFGYGLLGLVVIGGSFFIGRSILRRARSTSEEKKTYLEGNAATYAKQIKMAFENDNYFGWGVDKKALRRIVLDIPSKTEFKKVINSYQKLYHRAMMADMKSKLKSTEYNEMLAIIAAKPESGTQLAQAKPSPVQYESWAKRLKAAFDITYGIFPGTDEDAIKAVFLEMQTQADFWKTAEVYKKLFGDDLVKDLKSELEFWEIGPMMDILNKKPKSQGLP
jgi:hypothetical protein